MKWKVFLISKKIHPIGISLRRLIKHPVLPTLNSLTLLESTTMKRTSFSKSVRTIGLMALLSVTISNTLQQPVQAQTGVLAQGDNGTCVSLSDGSSYYSLPKGVYYQEFGGITFSPEQKAEYRKIEAKINARYEAISRNTTMSLVTGGIVYTPAQTLEGPRIGRDFEAQTMRILTPEQQKIYQANLTLQQKIQACGPSQVFDRIISPLPY
jgi:hypothetical protein